MRIKTEYTLRRRCSRVGRSLKSSAGASGCTPSSPAHDSRSSCGTDGRCMVVSGGRGHRGSAAFATKWHDESHLSRMAINSLDGRVRVMYVDSIRRQAYSTVLTPASLMRVYHDIEARGGIYRTRGTPAQAPRTTFVRASQLTDFKNLKLRTVNFLPQKKLLGPMNRYLSVTINCNLYATREAAIPHADSLKRPTEAIVCGRQEAPVG